VPEDHAYASFLDKAGHFKALLTLEGTISRLNTMLVHTSFELKVGLEANQEYLRAATSEKAKMPQMFNVSTLRDQQDGGNDWKLPPMPVVDKVADVPKKMMKNIMKDVAGAFPR
jgi:hypothetical protein